MVAQEATGEAVKLGQVVGVDSGDPAVEPVPVTTDEHLRESGDVAGGLLEARATGEDRL
ncbi:MULTISPECIES: hypothetical protein [unclassified Frankia]|uniref:hypothetical protein n=1 Tax=unclassified Frankia TaxID=2632575 RepID=UPI001A7E0A7B|nr:MULTISPECIES: hypothetical protein [unclassified Frankia]